MTDPHKTRSRILDIQQAEAKLVRDGFFSATYFNKLSDILKADGHDPIVKMQVFQRQDTVLAGVDEVLNLFFEVLMGSERERITIHALPDGSLMEPNETAMLIEGPLSAFARYESVYLGILARMSRVATNTREVVVAAGGGFDRDGNRTREGKPILFAADRFDIYEAQAYDGEAAMLGGAAAVCTEAMGYFVGVPGMGTMPHALIAAYGGDTVKATLKYAEHFPDEPVVSLVDFHNDCVTTSLEVARALGDRLSAVRLDTSGNMVDEGVKREVEKTEVFDHTWNWSNNYLRDQYRGVTPKGVHLVRDALDAEGFQSVQIIVSGGFNPNKIRAFENANVPVDKYLVGSSLIKNGPDFTADIVEVDGKPMSKVGRQYSPNPRLQKVEF